MPTNVPYLNTTVPPSGGANAFAGQGQEYLFTLTMSGTGGEATIILTSQTTGIQTQIGFGNVTGINFTYCLTFSNKVYGLAGGTVYISAINDPTTWNNPNALGNGFLTLSNWWGTPETLLAMSPYQGRLVFFSRRTTQIWLTDPNLENWELIQVLTNIGTLAPLSVQALGDLDVLFLSDTGIRSLRVRDNTLNAFVTDVGSPVDTLIQTALLAGNYGAACSIVEPQENRYWCYLNGTIYVFSFFPSNKISAWGSYLPTYPNDLTASASVYPGGGTVTYTTVIGRSYFLTLGEHDHALVDGNNSYTTSRSFFATTTTMVLTGIPTDTVTAVLEEQTPFVPSKFVVYSGQVYARDTNAYYLYGGTTNNQFDGTIAVAQTAWLDLKTPGTRKTAEGLDSAFSGAWQFFGSMDWQGVANGASLDSIIAQPINYETFQLGEYSWSSDGYHITLKANSSGNGPCVLSSLVFHYQENQEK